MSNWDEPQRVSAEYVFGGHRQGAKKPKLTREEYMALAKKIANELGIKTKTWIGINEVDAAMDAKEKKV